MRNVWSFYVLVYWELVVGVVGLYFYVIYVFVVFINVEVIIGGGFGVGLG